MLLDAQDGALAGASTATTRTIRLAARANDGFWTPGMGESALDAATAPAAVPVFNPKAAPTAPAVAPVFIITSVVKIVRPVTETEVVMIEPTTASDVASPAVEAPASSPSASPSNNPSGVFAGGESSPYIRVVAPSSSAAAPAEAATPVETPSQVRSSTSPAFTSSPLGASSQAVDTSGRVVAEPTQSQVRAVLVTTSADEPSALVASSASSSPDFLSMPAASGSLASNTVAGGQRDAATSSLASSDQSPDSRGSSALVPGESASVERSPGSSPTSSSVVPGIPEATRSSSILSHLGDSPGNIALTALVCLAIVATLLAVPVFCLCRRQRRRRRERFGRSALGSDGGSPVVEEGWPIQTADARWSPPLDDHGTRSGELGGQVRQMRELWRESALSDVSGDAAAAGTTVETLSVAETSEWTSYVGGQASTDEHGSIGYFDATLTRGSDSTVTPEVLERRRLARAPLAVLGLVGGQPRAPHPLRTSMRPDDLSPSTRSPSSGPFSPHSPAYHASGLASPFVLRGGADVHPTLALSQPNPPVHTKPLWRESLDRVMGAAADLISTTHLSRDSDDGDTRRGSLTRPSVGLGLRRAPVTRRGDEEKGEKALVYDEDEKSRPDWFSSYLGPRAPLVGSSVASSVADIERPVSPPSPLLQGYVPARGAMATVVPPRPAHVRAASSRSVYDVRPALTRGPLALPPAFTSVREDHVDPLDPLGRRAPTPLFPPSPEVPPQTPPVDAAPLLAPMRASPAPFSQLDPARPLSAASVAPAIDPFTDPTPRLDHIDDPSPSLPRSRLSILIQHPSRSPSPTSSAASSQEETLSQLAHDAAFAQLALLRRMEVRRSSTPSPLPAGSLRTRFPREGAAAVRATSAPPRDDAEDDDISSLDLSSSSSLSLSGAGEVRLSRPLETVEERLMRRERVALERERAAALMLERRRRSLCGESVLGGGSRRVSVFGPAVQAGRSDSKCTV